MTNYIAEGYYLQALYGNDVKDQRIKRFEKEVEELKSLVEYKEFQIQTLMKYNKANSDWGTTLYQALENLYNDYASYYPSAVDNSPAMKAAYELLNEEEEESK